MRRRIAAVLAGLTAMGGLVVALWTQPSLAYAASAISRASVVARHRIPIADPGASVRPGTSAPVSGEDREDCEDAKGPEQEGREPDADTNGEKEGHELDRDDTCPSPTPTPTPTPSPSPTPTPSPSGSHDRQSIRVTVPNAIVRIFECSTLGTRCRFDHQYQLNPPFNKKVPMVFVNRFVTGNCDRLGDDGGDVVGGVVGEFDAPGRGLALLSESQCKPQKPRKGGRDRDHHRHGEEQHEQHEGHNSRGE